MAQAKDRTIERTMITTHCELVLIYQAQAPKLKASVLEMEEALKKKYDDAATGDYTLWATGPDDALEMLRVRRQNPLITYTDKILTSWFSLFRYCTHNSYIFVKARSSTPLLRRNLC